MAGRPRNRAPDGFATVREAAKILGVSEQAIRARLDRGTLTQRVDPMPNGEVRRYVPREAIDDALRSSHELATRDDAAEITLAGALLAKEMTEQLVAEIHRHEVALTSVIEEQGHALLDQLQKGAQGRIELSEFMREFTQENKEHKQQMKVFTREMRKVAIAVLVVVIVLTILAAADLILYASPF